MMWQTESIAEHGDTLLITLCKRIEDLQLLLDARDDELCTMRALLIKNGIPLPDPFDTDKNGGD